MQQAGGNASQWHRDVFDDDAPAASTHRYGNGTISNEKLQTLRNELTRHYVDAGYDTL